LHDRKGALVFGEEELGADRRRRSLALDERVALGHRHERDEGRLGLGLGLGRELENRARSAVELLLEPTDRVSQRGHARLVLGLELGPQAAAEALLETREAVAK